MVQVPETLFIVHEGLFKVIPYALDMSGVTVIGNPIWLNKYELNEINFITINFMMKIKYFKLVMIFI